MVPKESHVCRWARSNSNIHFPNAIQSYHHQISSFEGTKLNQKNKKINKSQTHLFVYRLAECILKLPNQKMHHENAISVKLHPLHCLVYKN